MIYMIEEDFSLIIKYNLFDVYIQCNFHYLNSSWNDAQD